MTRFPWSGSWSWSVVQTFVCNSWEKRKILGIVEDVTCFWFTRNVLYLHGETHMTSFMSLCSQALRRCCWMLKWASQGRGATTLQRSWYGMHPVTPLLTLYALVWLHITASRPTPCCWPNTNQTNTPGKKSQTGWEEKSCFFFLLFYVWRTLGWLEEMLKLWRVWDVAISDLQ